MLAYRIEHRTSLNGPYSNWPFAIDLCLDHQEKWPTPGEDPSLGMPKIGVEYCATDSAESLLTWFDGWLDKMERDFRVAVYEADQYRVGLHGQMVFTRDSASLVTTYTISELVAEAKQLS